MLIVRFILLKNAVLRSAQAAIAICYIEIYIKKNISQKLRVLSPSPSAFFLIFLLLLMWFFFHFPWNNFNCSSICAPTALLLRSATVSLPLFFFISRCDCLIISVSLHLAVFLSFSHSFSVSFSILHAFNVRFTSRRFSDVQFITGALSMRISIEIIESFRCL